MTGSHFGPIAASQMDTVFNAVYGSNLSPNYKITRSSTVIIATSTSSIASKEQVDYYCDGTDDNIQIQAALDAIQALGGGEIKLLEGTFNISSEFPFTSSGPKNVIIKGCGRNTILKAVAAIKVLNFIDQNSNITIQDLTIDCNNIGTYGLYADTTTQVGNRTLYVDNIVIKHATAACICWKDANVDGISFNNSEIWPATNAIGLQILDSYPCNYFAGITFYNSTGGTAVQIEGGAAYFDKCIFTGDGQGGIKSYVVDAKSSSQSGQVGIIATFTHCHFEPAICSHIPLSFGDSSASYKWELVSFKNCWIGCVSENVSPAYSMSFNDFSIQDQPNEGSTDPATGNLSIKRCNVTVENCVFRPRDWLTAYIHFEGTAYDATIWNNAYEIRDTPIYDGTPSRAIIDIIDASGNRLNYVNGSTVSPLVSYVPVPASATASGYPGQIAKDSNYLYICIAESTWVRTPLSTWT